MKWLYDATLELWHAQLAIGSMEVLADPDNPDVFWYLLMADADVQSDELYETVEEAQAAAIVDMRARLQKALQELGHG